VKVMFRGAYRDPRLNGQATAFNLLSASGLAQSRRLRMASSTSASACLASRASGSLCAELHRRQLIFSGYDTRLGLL
jgi:hypothetical protein